MSTPTTLVTLAEVKSYLNIFDNSTDDTELLAFIEAATRKIQEITGPVLSSTVTEYRDGGREKILLRERPVLSVTSVTELVGGTQMVLTQAAYGAGSGDCFSFDASTSEITRRVGNEVATFADGMGNIKVVYVSGFASVPSEIALAAKALVQHWWSSSQLNRQGGRPNLGGTDYSPALGGGYAIPNFVREMLPQRDNVSWLA